MQCRDCPYIREKFIYKTENVDIEDYYSIEEHCHCDKVGGKLILFGRCSDSNFEYSTKINKRKRKRKTKRERDEKYKRHLKFLSDNCQGYPEPTYPVDEYGNYFDKEESDGMKFAYYKRLYRRRASKHHKRLSNRKVRRYKGEIKNGGSYRRLYDYWWEMY